MKWNLSLKYKVNRQIGYSDKFEIHETQGTDCNEKYYGQKR